jgi:YfiH family protein
MFLSKKLTSGKNLKHCFFSRKNGFSTGLYQSLNCGLGSQDNKVDVLKNLEVVGNKIGCKKESLITLNQIHSNEVVYFKNEDSVKNKLNGDAMVTKVKNIALGILSADCAAILFYNPKKKIIGCAHSGWKGALSGVIQNTVSKFKELGGKNDDLIVAVGPCLGKENFEVQNDFYEKFMLKNSRNKESFEKKNNNTYLFDLRSFINKELGVLGINNVENIEIDTYSNSENFYSYRRSSHQNEKDYGRCISVILMT